MRMRLPMLVVALAGFAAMSAKAQTFPDRQLTLVVPFAAGGPTDLVARVLAEKLAPRLGQAVIVENRVGAGGDTGGQAVAKAAPNGHTLLLSTTGSLTVNRHLKPNPDYDALRDFKPITLAFKTDHVVVVRKGLPVQTLAELIAVMKAEPGKLNYGSAGLGTTSHMIAELFKAKADVDMKHVPYRGADPALNDLVADHIDMMVASLANSLSRCHRNNTAPSVARCANGDGDGSSGFLGIRLGRSARPAYYSRCHRRSPEPRGTLDL